MIKRLVSLDEVSHRYTDEKSQEYTSVTTLIGNYSPKFDTINEAKKYAAKNGMTAEYWIGEWDRIRNEACDRGNEKHNQLEGGVNNFYNKDAIVDSTYTITDIRNSINKMIINKAELDSSPLKYIFPEIYKVLVKYIEQGYTLITEKIVYWVEYLVAGKIDLLLLRGKKFRILDWKTNKDELMFISGYRKKDSFSGLRTGEWVNKDERLFKPLDNLQYCKGTTYTIQLSLYAFLVELWGYELEDDGLELWHIRGKEEKKYNIKYLKNDVKRLLEYNIISKNTVETKLNFNTY